MGGRGSIYSDSSISSNSRYSGVVPEFDGNSSFVEKYRQELPRQKISELVDLKKSSPGYVRQMYEKQEKKFISAYAAVERSKLVNLSRERLVTIRNSSRSNADFFSRKLGLLHELGNESNLKKRVFYEKRFYYYSARAKAADSQLRSIQLRENIRKGKRNEK